MQVDAVHLYGLSVLAAYWRIGTVVKSVPGTADREVSVAVFGGADELPAVNGKIASPPGSLPSDLPYAEVSARP